MSVYTVHAPPPRSGAPVKPEEFVFVRDGFHFWAFVFPPVWLALHRLWLALLAYVIVTAGLEIGLQALRAGGAVTAVATLLISLFVGLEAGGLRRFGLGRRGWRNVGHVIGDSQESAEHRFFDAWTARDLARAAAAADAPRVPTVSALTGLPQPSPSGVIGLFPEAGGGR